MSVVTQVNRESLTAQLGTTLLWKGNQEVAGVVHSARPTPPRARARLPLKTLQFATKLVSASSADNAHTQLCHASSYRQIVRIP